jgi:hypothetical protein
MRLVVLLFILYTVQADVLLAACQKVFATHDGSYLAVLSTDMTLHLNNQLKKVTGIEPESDWNITIVRELPDSQLTELLLLALIGNYTTGASQSWQQPCKTVINAKTGLFQVFDDRSLADEILSVLVIVFCVIKFKQLLEST